MGTADYRAYTDTELADCLATIEQVIADRRTIATEAELVAVHEAQAQAALDAIEAVHAAAAAARQRQNRST